MNTRFVASAVAVLCSILYGCGTPPEVGELAEATSANVSTIGAQLEIVSRESKRLAELRAQNVARLSGVNANFRARYRYYVALTRKSGEGADLDLIAALEAWSKEVEAIYAETRDVEGRRREAILSQQLTIDTKGRELRALAESLSGLARGRSAGERGKFLVGFIDEVNDDLKAKLKDGSEASERAKLLIEKTKSGVHDK